jgi:hypothetical protein
MNDEQLQSLLEEEFRAMNTTPEDVERSTREVLQRKAHVRQRSRWWPFPVFYRRTQSPTTNDTSDYQPSPIPATNGLSPTILGRTQSMFSPVKAITAGALVFTIGGAFLIAQPFDQQVEVAPGAEAEFAPPVEVTGTFGTGGGCSRTRQDGDETTLPGSDEQYTCTATWSMSDARLSGSVTLINENYYLVGNGLEESEALSIACAEDPECVVPDLETFSWAMSVENDNGVWRQRPSVSLSYPGWTEADKTILVMDGEQGYEGLVAVLEATSTDAFEEATYYGFILDARQLKTAPENASTK